MKIAVYNVAASTGGALSVSRELYSYATENAVNDEWYFFMNEEYFPSCGNVHIITVNNISSWLKRLWFVNVTGHRQIEAVGADVVISLDNIFVHGLKIPQAVYIHNALPFVKEKNFSFLKSEERHCAVYQKLIGGIIKKSAKRADAVIVQSKTMKNYVEAEKVSSDKILLAPPHIGSFLTEPYALPDPCRFFYPSSPMIFKNNKCLEEAVKILANRGISDFKAEITVDGNDTSHIHYLGRIPREEVIERYRGSVLVFPSYLESAPLPLWEAKKIGTMIFASDLPFSHEALDGYPNVYYFNSFDPISLANLLEKSIKGELIFNKITQKEEKEENTWQNIYNLLVKLQPKKD